MNKTIFRFKFLDMPVSVPRSAQVGTLILVIIGTAIALIFTDLTPLDALIAGILMMIIHWLSDFVHQYGHFFAAKRVQKPSTGLKLWWILGTTRYPSDEGDLSPQIHAKRAIGGPIASTLLLLLFIVLWIGFQSKGGVLQLLLAWGIFLNAGVFVSGSLIPASLGWFNNDGAILLRSWREIRAK